MHTPPRPGRTELTIGQLAARTGVPAGTLRMWERRFGFPESERLPSGHRRYGEVDAERVLQVQSARDAGLSLAAAIDRVRQTGTRPAPSIFSELRRSRPALPVYQLRKAAMVSLSRAIEDESCATGERPLLIGAFQRERFYRRSEARWRELARTAELAVAFADFGRLDRPPGGTALVPIDRSDPLTREWAVVICSPRLWACLVGWEHLDQASRDPMRVFEAVWSVEPDTVRVAADVCRGLAQPVAPEVADEIQARLDPMPADLHDRARPEALAWRMIAYVAGASAAMNR